MRVSNKELAQSINFPGKNKLPEYKIEYFDKFGHLLPEYSDKVVTYSKVSQERSSYFIKSNIRNRFYQDIPEFNHSKELDFVKVPKGSFLKYLEFLKTGKKLYLEQAQFGAKNG